MKWRRDSRDLKMILEARQISRQAALNAIVWVKRERDNAAGRKP